MRIQKFHLGADHLTEEKISCTIVIESLWEEKGKKNPAHQVARKKNSWWPEIACTRIHYLLHGSIM